MRQSLPLDQQPPGSSRILRLCCSQLPKPSVSDFKVLSSSLKFPQRGALSGKTSIHHLEEGGSDLLVFFWGGVGLGSKDLSFVCVTGQGTAVHPM